MKIGIFTLPFSANYGGILQAFALQTILERMGHEVVVLKHHDSTPKRLNIKVRYLIYIKRFILKYIFRKNIIVREDKVNREKYIKNISEINSFISTYIKSLKFDINKPYKPSLNAIIVGSDQVWRPLYANPIKNYFLDFLYGNHSIRKIAYAASFGTDNWEYTDNETNICSKLVKDFDAVTVREDSAVKLCKKHLGVKVTQVLDPTMLLNKEDYIKLAGKKQIPKFNGYLFAYILDKTTEKNNFTSLICNELGLKIFEISSIDNYNCSKTAFPALEIWLKALMNAEFIVTDSYHGCVFSIIFNKPFIIIGNEKRGLSRFYSLLSTFHLQNRLMTIHEFSSKILTENIDWDKVNNTLKSEQLRSISTLENLLKLKQNQYLLRNDNN